MSLSTWIRVDEVRQHLDAITPPYRRMLDVPQLVPPNGTRHLIGVAFDYAVRFSLQRRCGAARGLLVGEIGAKFIEREMTSTGKRHLRKLRERVGPTYSGKLEMLPVDTLRLAQLDMAMRAGPSYFDERAFIDPPASDREQVRALLSQVPWKQFEHKRLRLNPTFGEYSFEIGGADADIISGDRLIELKTVEHAWVEREYVRQLLGYFLLDRWSRPSPKPRMKRIELYFSRHATFFGFDVAEIVVMPDFKTHERWLRGHLHFGVMPPLARKSA